MSKTYFVGVVGESHYQPAIRRCRVGESVHIVHEPDNPYGKEALVVVSAEGHTVGYIPSDCWLQDAIHEEGKGCEATIKEINSANAGKLGIVLNVTLCGGGVETRAFSRASPSPLPETKGWLARFLNF